LYQAILPKDVPAGTGLGTSVQLKDNNLLVGNDNEYIHAFQRNSSGTWEYRQRILSPSPTLGKFASVMSLYGRDLMVGAPYMLRQSYNTTGQGEVYHFYLSETTNTWTYIMPLGDFYGINTVAGNFGTDVRVNNKICVVGSPGEAYLEPGGAYELPNVGRVYIFNKGDDGLFSQGSVISPLSSFREKYMFYGQSVGLYDTFIAVTTPYTIQKGYSYLSIYNTTCLFPAQPGHQTIPNCSISLLDRSGYMIDLQNSTYLQSLSCILNP
jgi:hypothetical protein